MEPGTCGAGLRGERGWGCAGGGHGSLPEFGICCAHEPGAGVGQGCVCVMRGAEPSPEFSILNPLKQTLAAGDTVLCQPVGTARLEPGGCIQTQPPHAPFSQQLPPCRAHGAWPRRPAGHPAPGTFVPGGRGHLGAVPAPCQAREPPKMLRWLGRRQRGVRRRCCLCRGPWRQV